MIFPTTIFSFPPVRHLASLLLPETEPTAMSWSQRQKQIKNAGGLGIPTVKPWNIEVIREKMAMVKDSGAFAVAMDIDAAGLPFLKNLTPPAGSKSVEDLREVKQAAGLPFIVKGIMTVKGAMKAKKPGQMQSLCQTTAGVSWISVLPPQRCSKRSKCSRWLHEDFCRRRHPFRCGCV